MIEFRKMSVGDAQKIAALEKLCFSAPWSENAISGELTNPLSFWVVAVDDDRLAGYVGSQSVLGEADMMNLAVDPAYRRQGVGKRLVSTLIDNLMANDVKCLTLEVRASNEQAIALYQQLGFSEIGLRPKYYSNPKEDALILRKDF